ncbi:MAG TPA: hypothetical protein VHM92_09005 [Allosphingosinicella sp.]|nr:hypothetical protein [Allosphingosinicella sp.]
MLVVLIFGSVAGFVILPSVWGAWARRRRRKHVAFDQRHGNLDLFEGRRGHGEPDQ